MVCFKIMIEGLSIMYMANMQEAKTNLSNLVFLATQGEEVVICKAGESIVKLVPCAQSAMPRVPGMLKGQIKMSDDFNDSMEFN